MMITSEIDVNKNQYFTNFIDIETGDVLHTIDNFRAVAVNSQTGVIISNDENNNLQIWSFNPQTFSKTLVYTLVGGDGDDLAESFDNHTLVQAGSRLIFWDLLTGTQKGIVPDAQGYYAEVFWSANSQQVYVITDGDYLGLASYDASNLNLIESIKIGDSLLDRVSVMMSPLRGQMLYASRPESFDAVAVDNLFDLNVERFIPLASLDRLNQFIGMCAPSSLPTVNAVSELPNFVGLVSAMSVQDFPNGCKGDLLAIANALDPALAQATPVIIPTNQALPPLSVTPDVVFATDCQITFLQGANLRFEPWALNEVRGSRAQGDEVDAGMRYVDANGFTWWMLVNTFVDDELWVREDLVSETPECASLELLTP